MPSDLQARLRAGHCEMGAARRPRPAQTTPSARDNPSSHPRSPLRCPLALHDSRVHPSVSLPPAQLFRLRADARLCLVHWAVSFSLGKEAVCPAPACPAQPRCPVGAWTSAHRAGHCTEAKRYRGGPCRAMHNMHFFARIFEGKIRMLVIHG